MPASQAWWLPQGRESVKLLLSALDDSLVEGPEIAEISIRPRTAYSIVGRGSVMAVISDDEPNAPSERLDLVSPANAAVFGGRRAVHPAAGAGRFQHARDRRSGGISGRRRGDRRVEPRDGGAGAGALHSPRTHGGLGKAG